MSAVSDGAIVRVQGSFRLSGFTEPQPDVILLVEIEKARLHFFRSPVDGRYTDVSFTSTPGVTELPGLSGKTADLSRLLTP